MDLKKIKLAVCFVLFTGFCGLLQAADVEFPLIQSMSYFPYNHNHILAKKEVRLSLDMYYSNIYMFDYDRTTINDMEMLSSTLGFGYGLSERLTLEIYFKTVLTFGGIMDKLIMDFHDLFGLPMGGRDEFPRNKVYYKYKDAFSHSGSPMALSPPVLGVLGRIYEKDKFRVNGRVAFGLPLASKRGFVSSKPFTTAGLILLYVNDNKRFSASWATHVSFFSSPKWLEGEDLRKTILHTEIRVDYKWLFAGFLYRSTPFKERDLGNGAYQLYLGVKLWKRFEFSLIEEFPPMDTTPDVSFNLRIRLLGR
jgi:hypothetical protein